MGSTKTFARNLVDGSTRCIGWLRRNRRLRPSGYPIKVNLGCGLSVAPGWLNIDGSLNALVATGPRWLHRVGYRFAGAQAYYSEAEYCAILRNHTFVHHELTHGIPLTDQSADFVYSSHFLEHLDRCAAQRLLEECLRVLKPGGVVRIGVPDLEYAWEMYRRGEKARMLHDYFFLEEAARYTQHRYAYDFDMLARLLTEIGYEKVERVAFQEGKTPDLRLLDNRGDYTLFVEACRPSGEDLRRTGTQPMSHPSARTPASAAAARARE